MEGDELMTMTEIDYAYRKVRNQQERLQWTRMKKSSEQKQDNDNGDDREKRELRKTYKMRQYDEVSKTMTENYSCRYLRTQEREILGEIIGIGK